MKQLCPDPLWTVRSQAETEPCSVQWKQILDVPVPETVKQLAEMPKIVSQDRIQEWTVEQTVDIVVPQDVEEMAEFFKASSQDRVQQRFREQIDHRTPCFFTH